VPGASVRGATNDFRIMGVPSALDYEFARLVQLVEDTAAVNGGAKVHLMSHSLGGPVANLFLNEMDAAWKQKFIASHVMLSPVLLGSPVAIYAALTGPRYDYVPQFLPQLVVPLVRTFPSIAWMWPRVSAEGVDVWSGGGGGDDEDAESGEIDFVRTPTQNYSLSNLKALARAMPGADNIVAVWDAMMARTNRSASDPGVPVLCVYANDTRTDLSISTSDAFDEKGKRLAATWGDGTVSLRSLEHCRSWADVEVRPIAFGGSLAAHTEIAQKPEVIDLVLAWLLKK
jgi:pimeloyl-ACP methyl ester carboxylesterase